MERRKFLGFGLSAVTIAALQSTSKANILAEHPQAFKEKNVEGAMKNLYGKTATIEDDKAVLKAPDIAENGAAVPITVSTSIENPKTMAVLIDGNPQPLAVAWEIPVGTIPEFSTRIKMRKTGGVTLVVEAQDGTLHTATKQIKVTVGGCGG